MDGHGKFQGEGGLKSQKFFKGKYGIRLEIPGGWEGLNRRTILGGGMDIFWNHTIHKKMTLCIAFWVDRHVGPKVTVFVWESEDK